MGKIKWFREYLTEIQDAVPTINRNRVAIEKSQLTKHLDSHSSSDNFLLLGIIPDFSGKGSNGDDFKLVSVNQLWIVKKTTYSEENYEDFYDIFDETFITVEAVVNKLLQDHLSGCNQLRFLNVASIDIKPVWNESSCNGWKILFNFDLSL
jgi:hypothetical protein